MQKGKFNTLVDLQFGSTGKAKIAGYLAKKYEPDYVSSTNMPNAGHTIVVGDDRFVGKALPSPAFFNKIPGDYNPTVILGPSAAFTISRLFEEIEMCNLSPGKLFIHPRAGVVTEDHASSERTDADGPKHIASTMQGCGAMLADKVMRKRELKLAYHYDELSDYIMTDKYMPEFLIDEMKSGKTILHEGAQGFSLDINHGRNYPNCTSRQTTSMQMAADMGIPYNMIGDVYGVFRTYPIRVGNVYEDGVEVGNSGGWYDDQREVDWEYVANACGGPLDFIKSIELTTVTKRLRRVATFSLDQLKKACMVNGVTKLAFNFANYIDWGCFGSGGGIREYNDASSKIKEFVNNLETLLSIPVTLIGTGPDMDHMFDRNAGVISSASLS